MSTPTPTLAPAPYAWINVNEEGEPYDAHATEEAALAVQARFPNDTVVAVYAEPQATPAPILTFTQRVHSIADTQGWTTETLLGLLLDHLSARSTAEQEALVQALDTVAMEEDQDGALEAAESATGALYGSDDPDAQQEAASDALSLNAWPEHDTEPCARLGEHQATQRHPFHECPTWAAAVDADENEG